MPAFEAQPGMPYWIDLTTSDIAKSSYFYENVLGWEINEVNAGYRMARVQGLPVAGFIEQPEETTIPDTWITYFLSYNLDEVTAKVVELGGRILAEPTEVFLGRMALAVDTAGALFGLIEPGSEESFVAAGEPGTPVWHELTTVTRYPEAVDFYGELFNWMSSELSSEEGGVGAATPPRLSTAPPSPVSTMPRASSRPRCRASGRPTWVCSASMTPWRRPASSAAMSSANRGNQSLVAWR